jgi:hypothetical protein
MDTTKLSDEELAERQEFLEDKPRTAAEEEELQELKHEGMCRKRERQIPW